MRKVLEIGCGFGRITRQLAHAWPEAAITALDLSPEQLANALQYCGTNPRIRFEQFDFYSGMPFPGANYDTVVAIEVFLHHPPEFVVQLFKRLKNIGQTIVSIDWSEDWPGLLPEHVWLHDYPKMFAEAGLSSAVFALPQKVDGKQQRLFIASGKLSEASIALERQLDHPASQVSPFPTQVVDDWTRKLRLATTELLGVIPAGASFILVEDGQWGNVRALNGHHVIPFRERNGTYWGPPKDDADAWDELDRLRRAGAAFIAFAWPSFWWLDHYGDFSWRLRREFPRLLENERLAIFKLTE
jgi:SAM-dependent methyltransferase